MADWQNYYLGMVGVSAVLVSLVFIALALFQALAWDSGERRERSDGAWKHLLLTRMQGPDVVVLGTQTYADFMLALFLSAAALVPDGGFHAPLVGQLVIAVAGCVEIALPALSGSRTPLGRRERRWRYTMPILAMLLAIGSAVLGLVGIAAGFYGMAIAVGLLIAIGSRNAWDILIRVRGSATRESRRGERGAVDAPTDTAIPASAEPSVAIAQVGAGSDDSFAPIDTPR
jgi:hypothetical protein